MVEMNQNNTSTQESLTVLSRVISFSLYTLIPLSALFLVTGILSGSLTIMAITFDCGLGLLIQLVGFFSIRTILKANLYQFPYGTGKLENFSSLFYGALSIPIAIYIIYSSFVRLTSPPVVIAFGIAQLPLIPALIRSVFLWRWTHRLTTQCESPMIHSYYIGAKVCTLFNVAVLVGISAGFLLSRFGQAGLSATVDPFLSLFIAFYLLYNGIRLTISNYKSLADYPLSEDDQLKILAALIRQYDKYDNIGNIYTRRSGGKRFIAIELSLSDETSMREIGELNNEILADLEPHFTDIDFSLIPIRSSTAKNHDTQQRSVESCTNMNDINQMELYDDFASDYHLLLGDWERDYRAQAQVLDRILKKYATGTAVRTVLDCMCGIGTQSIGLAELRYSVTGTDISKAAITRAQKESQTRGVAVNLMQADLRSLEQAVSGTFDAVICCDNSLLALLTEEDVLRALTAMRSRLDPDGLCIISIRDYDQIFSERKTFLFRHLHEKENHRTLVFDTWEYLENQLLKCNVFFVTGTGREWSATCRPLVFKALYRKDMKRILERTGFALCDVISEMDGVRLQFDHYICRAKA